MRFLVFSDLHAHPWSRFSKRLANGRNSRLEDTLQTLKFIRQKATELDVDGVIFSGDLFDAKTRIPLATINVVYREFSQWTRPVLMIPGNHDFLHRSGSDHALEVFRDLEGFTVVDEPAVIEWELKYDVVTVAAVPYREEMRPEWFADAEICVAHGSVVGSKYAPNGLHILPPEMAGKEPGQYGEGISMSWLDRYKLAVVGHIHYPQALGNVLIPGMPMQQHPHELDQKRGVWLVELDTTIPLPAVEFTRLETGSPTFMEALVQEDEAWCLSNYAAKSTAKGNIVLLRPTCTAVPESAILQAKQEIESHDPFYVEVLPSQDALAGTEDNVPRIEVDAARDPVAVLDAVLGSGLVDLRGLDVEAVARTGRDLLVLARQED